MKSTESLGLGIYYSEEYTEARASDAVRTHTKIYSITLVFTAIVNHSGQGHKNSKLSRLTFHRVTKLRWRSRQDN